MPVASYRTTGSIARDTLRECDRAFLAARAIDATVAAERGYTATDGAQLAASGFSQTQAALGAGLLIPIHAVDGGIVYHQLRPDTPRHNDNGTPRKYEVPAGQRMVLDCHPRVRHQLGNPRVPLFITESAPKGDALVSKGYVAVALNGCWGWRGSSPDGGKVVLADFENVALNGRDIFIAFDSDAWTNPNVADATERLGAWLDRKARVRILRIPAAPDGTKMGIDDYIASGGDLDALIATAVPLGRFVDERPRRPDPDDDDDADYWRSRALAAEARHRSFMNALRCPNPSVRKAIPTLAAIHYSHDSAVSREANTDPRILRSLAADGSLRITRQTLSEISGRSPGTVTNDLQLLEAHGCLTRGVTRLFAGDVDPDTGEVVTEPRSIMRVMPARSAVANFRYMADVPKPDTEKQDKGWGGVRKTCEACGGERLHVVCVDCGHHQALPAPSPEKPTQTVKAQVALSGSTNTVDAERPSVPPDPAPYVTKGGNLHFHDVDRENERRQALRHVQPAARHHREPATAPPIPLDVRIVAAVTTATTAKRPLHEGDIARAVKAPSREVTRALRLLASQRRITRWDDGFVTAITNESIYAAAGAD
jgi:hypothetical protein